MNMNMSHEPDILSTLARGFPTFRGYPRGLHLHSMNLSSEH